VLTKNMIPNLLIYYDVIMNTYSRWPEESHVKYPLLMYYNVTYILVYHSWIMFCLFVTSVLLSMLCYIPPWHGIMITWHLQYMGSNLRHLQNVSKMKNYVRIYWNRFQLCRIIVILWNYWKTASTNFGFSKQLGWNPVHVIWQYYVTLRRYIAW